MRRRQRDSRPGQRVLTGGTSAQVHALVFVVALRDDGHAQDLIAGAQLVHAVHCVDDSTEHGVKTVEAFRRSGEDGELAARRVARGLDRTVGRVLLGHDQSTNQRRAMVGRSRFIRNDPSAVGVAADAARCRCRVAALHAEAAHEAMECGSGVGPRLDVLDEVAHGVGRLILEELNQNRPAGCGDLDDGKVALLLILDKGAELAVEERASESCAPGGVADRHHLIRGAAECGRGVERGLRGLEAVGGDERIGEGDLGVDVFCIGGEHARLQHFGGLLEASARVEFARPREHHGVGRGGHGE